MKVVTAVATATVASAYFMAPKTLDTSSDYSIRNVAATIAYDAMSYYKGNTSSNPTDVGDLSGTVYYWWVAGALWGAMLDYYHYTLDPTYNDVVIQALLAPANMGANQDYVAKDRDLVEGNDDLFFWGSAVLSAAERNFPQPNADLPSWLELSENVVAGLESRWNTTNCGGGLTWQIYPWNPNGLNYKNSVSNGGFFQLAARLARATGDDKYLDWANRLWDWSWDMNLINHDTWHVFDGVDAGNNCSKVNYNSFTYTAAIYLYGAAVMAEFSGEQVWKDRAESLLGGAGWFFGPFKNSTDIMSEAACELTNTCNADMTTFKGYASRFMWQTAIMLPDLRSKIEKYLIPTAKAAAKSCSGGTTGRECGLRWYTGGFDGDTGLGQEMCALETIQGLLIDNVGLPLKGDSIKVVRDTDFKPLDENEGNGAKTTTGSQQPTTTKSEPTHTNSDDDDDFAAMVPVPMGLMALLGLSAWWIV
ncbi:mannan endo-1,6-alpha-mannosidase [Sarocladium strictum]